MQKKASLLIGLTLVALGVLALIANLVIQANGVGFLLGFRAWPIIVIGAGLLFCLPPFIFRGQRGLSGLFMPGIPTLVTGLILFWASVTGNWGIWALAWPLEVLSVAAAFILMAIFLKVPWLMIPASIVGFTGLILQFCAVTGWWSSWAVLWTVELLAIGLPLLLIGLFKRMEGVKLAGLILCGLAGIAFAGMSSVLVTSLWITRLIGPAVVLAVGILLVLTAMRKPAALFPTQPPEPPAEKPAEESAA
jgi:hypothetical protein